ncbi:DUF7351 domain-containing protein [Halobaculum marinum]|uniref:Helix-turn-helix domain-containing protein n=1 Tax=Halobaculum marinum TaxID=3031996 RepID=A0ABD5WQ64_9EURY|nr:helix-turn-helix domain-containing protein [Halobaculum sp. DT55]
MTRQATTAEDAFAALGSEPRLTVLRHLADAELDGDSALTFTELYDRFEMDSTSRLSYHLDQLTDVFVQKTDDGYSLTPAGDRVVRAVLSGTFSEQASFEPTTVDGKCPSCGHTQLGARYQDRLLTVRCPSCETTVVTYDLPPSGTKHRSAMEVLRSCNRRVHHEYAVALRGTCAQCGGPTEVTIEESDGISRFTCVTDCTQCRMRLFAPLEARLLHHPAVVSFYWQCGIDIVDIELWNLATYLEQWETEYLDGEEFRCAVTVTHGSETLRTVVDADLDVTIVDT